MPFLSLGDLALTQLEKTLSWPDWESIWNYLTPEQQNEVRYYLFQREISRCLPIKFNQMIRNTLFRRQSQRIRDFSLPRIFHISGRVFRSNHNRIPILITDDYWSTQLALDYHHRYPNYVRIRIGNLRSPGTGDMMATRTSHRSKILSLEEI